jgi:hypothetical protein
LLPPAIAIEEPNLDRISLLQNMRFASLARFRIALTPVSTSSDVVECGACIDRRSLSRAAAHKLVDFPLDVGYYGIAQSFVQAIF